MCILVYTYIFIGVLWGFNFFLFFFLLLSTFYLLLLFLFFWWGGFICFCVGGCCGCLQNSFSLDIFRSVNNKKDS